jgi:hypothetical protein
MRAGTEGQPASRCDVQFQAHHSCNRDLIAHVREAHGETGRFACYEHLYRVLREMRRDCAAHAFIVTFLGEDKPG